MPPVNVLRRAASVKPSSPTSSATQRIHPTTGHQLCGCRRAGSAAREPRHRLQCLNLVHLPAVLARFLAAHPGLEIQLRHGGSGDLIEQVRAGRLDLAFVSRPARSPDDVVVRSLASEPLVLACAPPEHPFATREQVEVGELAAEQFVDFQPDWATRDLVDSVLPPRGSNAVSRWR